MNETYVKSLFSLEGKKAVVTGASSGIGRAIALSLSCFGADVALLGRTMKGLSETRALIEEQGGTGKEYIVDISKEADQDRFFEEYMEENGKLDIFVANAGINIRAELPDATLDEIHKLVETDYIGTLYGMIWAAKLMKPQRSGNIVVITSVNALSPLVNQAVYSSVKFGLEGAMKCMAGSMAEYGVRVNSCAPGCIHSALNEHIFGQEEYRKAKEALIPLGRIGDPRDIGDVVAAIVSDACRFMTGSTILVDGGELIRPKQKQPRIDLYKS